MKPPSKCFEGGLIKSPSFYVWCRQTIQVVESDKRYSYLVGRDKANACFYLGIYSLDGFGLLRNQLQSPKHRGFSSRIDIEGVTGEAGKGSGQRYQPRLRWISQATGDNEAVSSQSSRG